jgi:hypothetical protein
MYLTGEAISFLRAFVEIQRLVQAVENDFCFAQRRLVGYDHPRKRGTDILMRKINESGERTI